VKSSLCAGGVLLRGNIFILCNPSTQIEIPGRGETATSFHLFPKFRCCAQFKDLTALLSCSGYVREVVGRSYGSALLSSQSENMGLKPSTISHTRRQCSTTQHQEHTFTQIIHVADNMRADVLHLCVPS